MASVVRQTYFWCIEMWKKSMFWNWWNTVSKKKKQEPFSLQLCVIFSFVYWVKRRINRMHLKLDPKPLILSRKISQYCVTLLTPGAISNPPCSVCYEWPRWTDESGISAWPCLATGPNGSRLWATFCSVNLPDCCQHIGHHDTVSLRLFHKTKPTSIKTHGKTRNVLLTMKNPTWQTISCLSIDSELLTRLVPTFYICKSSKINGFCLWRSLKSDYLVIKQKEGRLLIFLYFRII